MKKFIVFIAVLSLIIAVPASSAFATKPPCGSGNPHCSIIGPTGATGATGLTGATGAAGEPGPAGESGSDSREGIATNNIEVNSTLKGYRGFVNQAEISYAPLPGYLGPARHDANVQSAKVITMYKDTFTRADVESMLKGVDVDSNNTVDKIAKGDRKSIRVIFVAPDKSTVVQCAIITTKATSKDTVSANVLGAAIISAIDVGADVLLVTAEGLSTELRSSGWGVGLAYSYATIASNERSGGIGSGGLGISGGRAGYKSFPWIQGIALKFKK